MQIETHVINGAACRHSVTDCRRLAGLQAIEWERAFRLGIGCAPSTFRDEWQAIVERTNWQLSWAELRFWHRHQPASTLCAVLLAVFYFHWVLCSLCAVINLAACSHNYLFSIVHVMRLWFLVVKLFINLIIVVAADVIGAAAAAAAIAVFLVVIVAVTDAVALK